MNDFFLARQSLVSDIPAGDGIIANLFLQCSVVKNLSGFDKQGLGQRSSLSRVVACAALH